MSSSFRMIDVGDKPETHRIAVARGEIRLSASVCNAIAERRVPKGDVLSLAEVAGINGAKRTADLLPLCHPLAIDAVRVECELDSARAVVIVRSTVSTHARTGVEMEALSAVSAALLCVYDLTKSLDKGAELGSITLEHKRGGKSGEWWNPSLRSQSGVVSNSLPNGHQDLATNWSSFRTAVITVSDRCFIGEREDQSGEVLQQFLRERKVKDCFRVLVPDEVAQIQSAVTRHAAELACDLVIITGGTGMGPRDVTPEALTKIWTKQLPGFGEQFRRFGSESTSRAWLSRAEAGLVGRALVILLPGSVGGVQDGIALLTDTVPHILSVRDGGGH